MQFYLSTGYLTDGTEYIEKYIHGGYDNSEGGVTVFQPHNEASGAREQDGSLFTQRERRNQKVKGHIFTTA